MDEKELKEILDKLSEKYNVILTLKKEPLFSVKDILDEYMPKICEKIGVENNYRYASPIENGIRKVLCLRYGVNHIKEVPKDKQEQFKIDLKELIENFILGGK